MVSPIICVLKDAVMPPRPPISKKRAASGRRTCEAGVFLCATSPDITRLDGYTRCRLDCKRAAALPMKQPTRHPGIKDRQFIRHGGGHRQLLWTVLTSPESPPPTSTGLYLIMRVRVIVGETYNVCVAHPAHKSAAKNVPLPA